MKKFEHVVVVGIDGAPPRISRAPHTSEPV